MGLEEKIAFLMETIPSEKEIEALKRRFLFGKLESELLREASATLKSSTPDTRLIDWAYEILQLRLNRSAKEGPKKEIPVQEKMERLIALFSNGEDLQKILDMEEWSDSDRRSLQLVGHFIANDIPLMTNIKIADKVYHLLAGAYLPENLAAKYFGRSEYEARRDKILESFRAYRQNKAARQTHTFEPTPQSASPIRRYAYLLGALLAAGTLYMAGFFTARYLYDESPPPPVTSTPLASPGKVERAQSQKEHNDAKGSSPEAKFVYNRVVMDRGLERLGLGEKADFTTRMVAAAADEAAFSGLVPRDRKGLLSKEEATTLEKPQFSGPMLLAVEGLGRLRGLALPLPSDINLSEENLPGDFRVEATESPASRIVYATDGNRSFPLEVYTFVGEPAILEYRLVAFKKGRYLPVPSDIWHFNAYGALRSHKHFVYQKGKPAAEKILTHHFLPGGGTISLVSTTKTDNRGFVEEFPLERKESLPDGKPLYTERWVLGRQGKGWRAQPVLRQWYDEGRKIRTWSIERKE